MTVAIEKALFGILDQAARASPQGAPPDVRVSQEQLVSAFRSLFEREKFALKRVGWNDLILPPETLTSLQRLVKLVEDPEEVARMGIDAPKGILLSGPPGTGKTTIARVIANEAKASFYSVSAADVYSKWLGESEKIIKKLFANARKHKPSIIFIDEIDSIMRARSQSGDGAEYADKITNQILQEIDGIQDSAGVFVIGATNSPQLIDPALVRGGRLSEKIEIPLPGPIERAKLFELFLKKARREPGLVVDEVAKQSAGLGGADIRVIVQQAIMTAFERGGKEAVVTQADLAHAIDKSLLGAERTSLILTAEEKKATAYHEAGHALVASLLKSPERVQRVSIVARGHALGFTLSPGGADKSSYWRTELLERIAVSLGGYVAEKLVYGDVSTGASSDLLNATNVARAMVTQYGMSDQVGPMVVSGGVSSDMSETQVRAIIVQVCASTEKLLGQYRTTLDEITQQLCEKETLDGDSLDVILSKSGVTKNRILE